MKIFVGIDNAKLTHFVKIISEGNGEKIDTSMEIENTYKGFKKLLGKLGSYAQEDLHIGFELPHGPLVDFLRQYNFHLYCLNPLRVKRFKEAYCVSGNKSDKIDSAALAEYLMLNHAKIQRLVFSSKPVEQLNAYRSSHDRLVKERTRYTNRLIYVVRQYFPLLDGLFSCSAPKILLKMLLKYPCWELLKGAAQTGELTEFLKENYYRVPRNIEKVHKKIRSYEQLISNEVQVACQIEATTIAHILLHIHESLDEIEKSMADIMKHHNLGIIFSSLPGAGKLLSARMLAVIGDNKTRFHNANNLQCLFGTAPKNYQSGAYRKVTIRKACNKGGRCAFYQFAFSSLKHCSWARNYYDAQRNKGKRHSVAIRALSNKWLKVIFTLWKNEILYEEEKIKFKVA